METTTKYEFMLSEILFSSGLGSSANSFASTLNKYGVDFDETSFEFKADDSYINALFTKYLALNARKEVAVISESDVNDSTNEDIVAWLERLALWLNKTYFYYKKMLDLYTAKEADLMAQVKTSLTIAGTNKSAVSDMPQTATFDNAPTSDVMSNLQQGESSETQNTGNDYGTAMQRLDEVRNHLENVYARWCEEFERTFVIY